MLFNYSLQEAIAKVERGDATFQDVYAAPHRLKMLMLFSLHVNAIQEAIAMVERGDATFQDVDAASDQLKMLTLGLNVNAI